MAGGTYPLLPAPGSAGKPLIRQKRSSSDASETGRARSHKKRKCLIPKEAVAQERALEENGETHITDLPTDMLVHIFTFLDSKLHKFILPLVCKQWYGLLSCFLQAMEFPCLFARGCTSLDCTN